MATKQTTSGEAAQLTIVRDATCTVCGCLCDDIDLSVRNNQIVEAKRACRLATPWFLDAASVGGPTATFEGKPVDLDTAIERAAQILISAKSPLVYGLGQTTSETQRVAVAIADWIGGTIDTPTSAERGPTATTFQGVGEVTCSLGEVASRADLLLFWGADLVETHPRHFERYSLNAHGRFVPKGRQGRTCIVIDSCRTATADQADAFIQIKPNSDFEVLWILRSLARDIPLDATQIERQTGVALNVWQKLFDRMKQARYGVIVPGPGVMHSRGGYINTEAVNALVRDMNAHARFVSSPLGGPGNRLGADSVLLWQTGYPFGVNFSRGFPRFMPGDYGATAMLERGEADTALLIATDPTEHLSKAAREHLAKIPTIIVNHRDSATGTVVFHTARYGIEIGGTVYRMDDVPLRLRPALQSTRPNDLEILTRIERRVQAI
jgi:formylmethanofuran dehydrogenase subunit B